MSTIEIIVVLTIIVEVRHNRIALCGSQGQLFARTVRGADGGYEDARDEQHTQHEHLSDESVTHLREKVQ